MPKVSAKQVQRRIAELDAQYTVAQPKRPGGRVVALIILAIIAVAAFSIANRTTSDFVQLTLKQGPAPAMLGADSTGFKRGERGDGHSQGRGTHRLSPSLLRQPP
jgi:hypothetical protein